MIVAKGQARAFNTTDNEKNVHSISDYSTALARCKLRAYSQLVVGGCCFPNGLLLLTRPTSSSIIAVVAGYRGEETPRRFYIGDRLIEIIEVIDRWLDPAHRYFKVRGDDDGIYILRHDEQSRQWELTMFDSGEHNK